MNVPAPTGSQRHDEQVGSGSGSAADAIADPRAPRRTDGPRHARRAAPASGRADPSRRSIHVGRAIVVVAVTVYLITLDRADQGVHQSILRRSWQLLELAELRDHLLQSVWYLNIQPPVHNLFVGGVLAWSPFPEMGTLFVAYGAALYLSGLLLHDILVRWRVGGIAAAVVVVIALGNPSLLSTIGIAAYEVPVALMVVAAIWALQRFLDSPRFGWLIALSVIATTGAMTRSLLNPVWVVALLLLAIVCRSVTWRQAAAALAIPVVLVGGWALKNQVLFGTPTLSSWLGFNLQRGVVAQMERSDVEQAVRDGDVSGLAREYPWGSLSQYQRWERGCRPSHDVAVLTKVDKRPPREVYGNPNFNAECWLPVYEQAQEDAITLMRAHPGRYLTTRTAGLQSSFGIAVIDTDEPTWLDNVYEPLLVTREVRIPTADWNLPLLGTAYIPVTFSYTLLAITLGAVFRTALAVVRLVRRGWSDRRSWPSQEVVWLGVGFTVLLVIVGGAMLEFGENGRFRAMVDPLIVALTLGALVSAVRTRLDRRAAS